MIWPIALTIAAAVWRFIDGRGWGPTWARNLAGLVVSIACATNSVVINGTGFGDTQTWLMELCALLAALTLIAGYTNWSSWVSLARYGGPTCVIGIVAHLGGGGILPCALYATGGLMVGAVYVLLQRTGWQYATAASEPIAGALIVGGLSWLAG